MTGDQVEPEKSHLAQAIGQAAIQLALGRSSIPEIVRAGSFRFVGFGLGKRGSTPRSCESHGRATLRKADIKSLYRKRSGARPSSVPEISPRRIVPDTALRHIRRNV